MTARRVFVSGLLIGIGVSLIIAGVIASLYAKKLQSSINEAEVARYSEALREYEEMIREIKESGLVDAYRNLSGQLPLLEQALSNYNDIYVEAMRNRDLVLRVYELTHSETFNETLEQIRVMAKDNNSIVGVLIGPLLEALADYMVEAQKVSAEAVSLVTLIERLPPDKLAAYIEAFKRLEEEMPPDRLGEALDNAQQALMRAEVFLARLNTSNVSSLADRLETCSLGMEAAGIILIAVSATALYAARRRP
jgi:type II secretory pathway pseudopilin PulG